MKKSIIPRKKSKPMAGMLLDAIGWSVRQVALPIPEIPEFLKTRKRKK